jgi:hypothetical protein
MSASVIQSHWSVRWACDATRRYGFIEQSAGHHGLAIELPIRRSCLCESELGSLTRYAFVTERQQARQEVNRSSNDFFHTHRLVHAVLTASLHG